MTYKFNIEISYRKKSRPTANDGACSDEVLLKAWGQVTDIKYSNERGSII